MEKIIKFNTTELSELTTVLSLCSKSYGYTRGDLINVIVMYYKKYGKAEVYYKIVGGRQFIDGSTSFVTDTNKKEVLVQEIITDLLDKGILLKDKLHASDKWGNLQYSDEEKTKKVLVDCFKIRKLKNNK